MKSFLSQFALALSILFILTGFSNSNNQEFQGKAYYFSKSNLDLGSWGARMSEGQKKQIAARLKNRLQKNYTLTFNKEASYFKEEDKLDAISGATDSWGKNFAQGDQYKNVKTKRLTQKQEFYGKKFLVKDNLLAFDWKMGSETKVIGNYTCFKATATVPTNELTWYDFSWSRQDNSNIENSNSSDTEHDDVDMTEIQAWYAPSIPVSHGPSEYWGLPGLILEISAGNTTILCSKIIMNPEDKTEIEAPAKGTIITKSEYQATIVKKMKEFRNNRMGRRRG
ncbi:MAG: GLPGLI family protein [Winogradskyella sp.]|uniref:GLPGLI family protein n=1 Tax=Winogradskyella sp. TaxID=1883156 RepID=UPI0017A84890|nr:GLPGLI family protein [Winogradskyella sp.]